MPLAALLTPQTPVSRETWAVFWDRLRQGSLPSAEAAATLAALSARLPDVETARALLSSLDRNANARRPIAASVNVVGTGGGPSTFNISTAAAFVAAATGVKVIKSGSRAYSSRCGSIDLLNRLGLKLCNSAEETETCLETFGIACTGYYVYPSELALLAKAIFPLPMKVLGRTLNILGPLLADIPVAAQMTGASDPEAAALLAALGAKEDTPSPRKLWVCHNAAHIDELVSFVPNVVHIPGSEPLAIEAKAFGLTPGSLDDLRPAKTLEDTVSHFLALLEGKGTAAALDTIALNAAALLILGDQCTTWPDAVEAAKSTLRAGHARALVERLQDTARTHSPHSRILETTL